MKSTDQTLSGIRILCVDDGPDVLEFLRVFLTREGAEVTTCASAEDAITTLLDERFDVLISDLSMPPGLDGYDLVHELRRMENDNLRRKATPSILLSGDAMRASRKRRFADFQVYMPKPFDNVRLIHVIERLAEADSASVKLGSLKSWEAKQSTEAAEVATEVAREATSAAVDATNTARYATEAAARATTTASKVEIDATLASANAPHAHY